MTRIKQRSLGPGDPREPLSATRTRYGLKPAEIAYLLQAQGGTCAGCGTTDWGPLGPVVDHDHSCQYCGGRGCRLCVRGILDSNCNVALGCVKDVPETLENLARYLRERSGR